MPIKLRVKEVAEEQGLNLSQLQREAKLPMSTARRLWYSSSNGKQGGPPLKLINLEAVERLAKLLDVRPGDLIKLD
jgi:DNA-binding Xre family transcriptional regulator